MQRAFLQSAMVQNLQIQQQLLAQNQALQTLLSQSQQDANNSTSSALSPVREIEPSPTRKQSFKNRVSSSPFSEMDRFRRTSNESTGSAHIPPPPPPPMPPPLEYKDPSEARPFLDPYGRAKTVRIGKWRWPPPQDALGLTETDENFMHFKMRQNQRKNTPQSQGSSPNGSAAAVEWEEFEVESTIAIKNSNHQHHQQVQNTSVLTSITHNQNNSSNAVPRKFSQPEPVAHQALKASRRSFEIGAERPPPGSVGKLKLSSEMRQRLEQVTAGHSVRSTTSTKSEQRAPAKLEDARKLMLQQQLSGHLQSPGEIHEISVRSQIQRMENGKVRPQSSAWPTVLPPAPPGPAPPPPIRPPTGMPPMPPPPIPVAPQHHQQIAHHTASPQEIPAFVQRQERDTFGTHQQQHQYNHQQQHWNGSETSKDQFDSWGRAEAAKLDLVYETNYTKKDTQNVDRERSRSRSRSRDRENFSESVWDRSEVEGPPSSGSDRERYKEREKRDRIYEIRQVERERESNKVYQPVISKTSTTAAQYREDKMAPFEKQIEREKPVYEKERSTQVQERATFKTHMAQRMESRSRKNSASTMVSQTTEKTDDIYNDDWTSPIVAAPVPVPPPTLKSPAAACLTYNRVPWKLRVRKEVFRPSETIGSVAMADLLFLQIRSDVFGQTASLRISAAERRNALNMLAGHGVTIDTGCQQVRTFIKRHLIDLARDWPLYFARLFVVSGSPQIPDVSILAVSHSGVYLARRDADHITVIRSVPFAELLGAATLPRPAALQLNMRNGNRTTLHAPRAPAIQNMVQLFCQEYRQVSWVRCG